MIVGIKERVKVGFVFKVLCWMMRLIITGTGIQAALHSDKHSIGGLLLIRRPPTIFALEVGRGPDSDARTASGSQGIEPRQ